MTQVIRARANGFYDRRKVSDDTGLSCPEPTLAVQSQKDEADINTIVKNFGITGVMPQGVRVPTYGDFDAVDDFQTAVHAVKAAEESFMQMPADVRAKFLNDPQRFVEFCSDAANLEEMRKLGLAVPKAEPEGLAREKEAGA